VDKCRVADLHVHSDELCGRFVVMAVRDVQSLCCWIVLEWLMPVEIVDLEVGYRS